MSTKGESEKAFESVEYFTLLAPEIQLVVVDYLEFESALELSIVSKYCRDLIVKSRVSAVKLVYNSHSFYTKARLNPDWIGWKFSPTHLALNFRSSLGCLGERLRELILAMNSLTTVIDPNITLLGEATKHKTLRHIKHYGCGRTIEKEITRLAKVFPNLEVLSVQGFYKLSSARFKKLHTIFITKLRCEEIKMIDALKIMAPRLNTLYLPVEEIHLDRVRKNAKELGIHLIADLFSLLKNRTVFADQFVENQRPYNFYRCSDNTLFRQAVRTRCLESAKYMLENGLTTLEYELYSYNSFPKEFDNHFNMWLDNYDHNPERHPFILDDKFNDENFIGYLISKGLDLNARIDRHTIFTNHFSKSPVVEYLVRHGDMDCSVRTLHNQNPFHLMAYYHAVFTFQIAVQRLKDLPQLHDVLCQYDDEDKTPLQMIFSKTENLGIVEILLGMNISLKTEDSRGVKLSSIIEKAPIPILRKLIEYAYKMEDTWILKILLTNTKSEQFVKDVEFFGSQGFDFNKEYEEVSLLSQLSLITPEVLNVLVRYGCDIYAQFKGNRTLLFNAVCSSNKETINSISEILANFNFDIKHVDNEGFTPLLRALDGLVPKPVKKKYEHLNKKDINRTVAEALIKAGANPNVVASGGKYALQMVKRDPQLFELLLEHGANINQRVDFKELKVMNTPLMDTIKSCPKYSWSTLAKRGDVRVRDDHGNTLLHITHSHYLRDLCQVHKDVNVQNVHGETPLFTRHRSTDEDLTCLLRRYADVTHVSKAGLTTLHNALLTGNNSLAIDLLKDHHHKLDLSALDNMGRSVGHLITSDYVFDHLHNAVSTRSDSEKKKIIKAFNNVDCYGITSAHRGLEVLSPESLAKFIRCYLLDLHPDTHLPLLNVAISNILKKSSDCARLLIEHGASVTCVDPAGNTPLHLLCGLHPLGDLLIPLLLEKGASITAKNNRGVAPIDMLPTIEAYRLYQFYDLDGDQQ